MGGAGNIPWSKVMKYADEYGVALPDERARLWYLIRIIDTEEYLPWLAEKQAKPSSPDTK